MKFPHSLSKFIFSSRSLVLLVCVATFANLGTAQKLAGSKEVDSSDYSGGVTPFEFGNNITCATLNASSDSRLTYITSDAGLKIGTSDNRPNGTYFFKTYTQGSVPVTLQDVIPGNEPSPTKQVRVLTNINSGGNDIDLFSSQINITAVILKVGNTSYVYTYPTGTRYSDTRLDTPVNDTSGISHIIFCFGTTLAPSAAPATISGRVVNTDGQGISGSRVSVLDPTSGATMSVRSNPFGYFVFDALPAGNLYIVSIADKRYTFNDSTRSLTLNEDIADMEFVANPE